jgi:hypothetical protein
MQSYNGVAKWAKTESAPFSMNFAAMKPVIRKEPKGTVLIISPFNFPILLSLPLAVGASIYLVFGWRATDIKIDRPEPSQQVTQLF